LGVANSSGGERGDWVNEGQVDSSPLKQGCYMSAKVTIEVDEKHEGIVRRALAMAEEMEQLALTAPDGTVFDACEGAVIEKGRTFQAHVLADAVARRIETAEKKGRRSACATADVRRKTEGPKNAG
jgi:hypothetical protein